MSAESKHANRSPMPALWVIALTACAGAAIMATGPGRQRLGDARAALDASQRLVAQGGDLTTRGPLLEIDRDRINEHLSAIQREGESTLDPSALMSRMNAVADASGVIIDRVTPRSIDPSRTTAAMVAPKFITQLTIQARGNFEGLTEFVSRLERANTFVSVQGVRVTPMLRHGMNDLSATIDLVHTAFAVPSDEELDALALTMPGGTP